MSYRLLFSLKPCSECHGRLLVPTICATLPSLVPEAQACSAEDDKRDFRHGVQSPAAILGMNVFGDDMFASTVFHLISVQAICNQHVIM